MEQEKQKISRRSFLAGSLGAAAVATATSSMCVNGANDKIRLGVIGSGNRAQSLMKSVNTIGGIQWAWRLLLATGKPVYADAVERLLYNAFLAGVSLAGTEYFYVNPLQHRDQAHQDENRSPAHGRRGWFDCACCPPNIMRTFASLDEFDNLERGRGPASLVTLAG